MSSYHQQLTCAADEVDINFWKSPTGVSVPDDELKFLLVPDAVESLAVGELAQQVHQYQLSQGADGNPITAALMISMGGLLPGILLYDHLNYGRHDAMPLIEFGTIGVSLYKGPDERYVSPRVQQESSVAIDGKTVLLIDDLGDRGDTLKFLTGHLTALGARNVLRLALYMKPQATSTCPAHFYFGTVPQDTWIITPREQVETMAKRVPVWKERGADEAECRRRLIELIGYPRSSVAHYLQDIYQRA